MSRKTIAVAQELGIPTLLFTTQKWSRVLNLPTGIVQTKDWAEVQEYFDGKS